MKKSMLAGYIFVILVVGIIIYFVYNTRKKEVPRIIWTYWHDENIPDLVRKCIKTWKMVNPTYEIVVLNKENLKKNYGIDLSKINIKNKIEARYADYARLFIIKKYGGIWMDSTTICTKSLSSFLPNTQYDFFGYYAPHTSNKKFPIPENWFFAAPTNSPFIKDWLKEALNVTKFDSEDEYINSIKKSGKIDIQDLESSLPYLVMHLCATVVQQRNPKKYKIILEDATKGPFKYLSDNGWNLPESLEKMCEDESLQTPLIKMRGAERIYLKDNNITCKTKNPMILSVFG